MMRLGAVVVTAWASTGCTGSDAASNARQSDAAAATAAAATTTAPSPATDPTSTEVATVAPGTASTAPGESAPSSGRTVAAPEALRFTAPLVGGGTIDAAAYAGQPVLFWFWAPY